MHPPYPEYVLDRIKSIAFESPCEEVGGVVVATPGAFRVVQIHNCSTEPDLAYIPYGRGLIEASKLGHLEFYWHTHINGNPNFSPSDITGIWETDIPWLLYNLQHGKFNYFDPHLQTPLLMRDWELGLTDCWSLVRDFYRWHLDITLPPPEHTGNPRPWADPSWNRYLEQLPDHFDLINDGIRSSLEVDQAEDIRSTFYFDRINDGIKSAHPYDLVLFHNPIGKNPAHIGVLIPTATGLQLLHHIVGRRSTLDPILETTRIHSLWRSKCPISPSNYSVLWGVDMGKPTDLKPPDLAKVSVFCVTNVTDSSDRSST